MLDLGFMSSNFRDLMGGTRSTQGQQLFYQVRAFRFERTGEKVQIGPSTHAADPTNTGEVIANYVHIEAREGDRIEAISLSGYIDVVIGGERHKVDISAFSGGLRLNHLGENREIKVYLGLSRVDK